MRRVAIPAIVIVMLMSVGLLGATPHSSVAQDATPDAAGVPTQLCTEEELLAGQNLVRSPSHKNEAFVQEASSEAQKGLYILVLTMPPGSCLEYRLREGMFALVVQEGTIEYQAEYDESTDPNDPVEVLKGDDDGDPADDVEVMSNTPTTLQAGEWLTQDRAMWFTWRNAGTGEAVVSVAGYAVPQWEDPCNGGCHGP